MSKIATGSIVLRYIDVAAGYEGVSVFRGLSFSLAMGEGVCVVGPNGGLETDER